MNFLFWNIINKCLFGKEGDGFGFANIITSSKDEKFLFYFYNNYVLSQKSESVGAKTMQFYKYNRVKFQFYDWLDDLDLKFLFQIEAIFKYFFLN